MTAAADRDFMHSANTLAARGLGRTWPNPSVGCVIVAGNRVLGRARTADNGRPHAEVQALAMAGEAARGATAYITLEPCSHHGRTGPCADALISAGVARCVVALEDPDPRVAGQGIARLKAAGLDVELGVGADLAAAHLSGYLTRQRHHRPEVILKLAATLDGQIATASGQSRWITGSDARRSVHHLRSTCDAVMVGIGTALADDPMLDVRGLGATRQPVRIVADTTLRLPTSSRLARTAKEQPLWLLHGEGAGPPPPEADAICVRRMGKHIDLVAALTQLGSRGLTRVLCEGGGTLAANLLSAGLVDRLALFTAGKAIGGDGIPAIGALGLSSLEQAPGFELDTVRSLGGDTLSWWKRGDT